MDKRARLATGLLPVAGGVGKVVQSGRAASMPLETRKLRCEFGQQPRGSMTATAGVQSALRR